MNKDLDERLIPNGEYRDALNLDLANSEGSNVGALQNIKGNVELRRKEGDPFGWQANYIEDLQNPICIGSIRDDKKETIYWFIAADNASAIAEYDQKTGYIKPVLVDKNGILNFSEDYLITGINILDKFLFWTDDQTEPKKINIEKFKRGSVNFNTHTKIPTWTPYNTDETIPDYIQVTLPTTQPDFTEEDITVIKKSPLTAPTLNMSASPFGNDINGTGITPVYTLSDEPIQGETVGFENFTYIPETVTYPDVYESLPTYGEWFNNTQGPDGDPNYYQNSNLPSGWDGRITFTINPIYGNDENGDPVWNAGDILVLSGNFTDSLNETYQYGLTVKIYSINNAIIVGEIQSISSNILKFADGDGNIEIISWEVILQEKKPMFEYVFPRFAYRWKYIDNEYSAFSPFSEVAFIGNEFEYVSSDGYNIGMTNNIRKLIIENLEWGSEEVSEIEILYKESHNTTVYSIDSIKKKDYSPYIGTDTLPTFFNIKSELIGNAIQANQLLRPWDNVPRKAKAQEIIANRIIYGNYLQNYSINNTINLSVNFYPNIHPGTLDLGDTNPDLRMPYPSLKSIRTYQIGLVFKDEYGRETPVITSKNASVEIPIANSDNINKLTVLPNGTPPDWATHYKFFIKETANEYYNLALDRFYFAEDGNIWLSFPSSERNKVDEETYLILKKQHDNDVAVDDLNRYKILAIENDAPEFIRTFERSLVSTTVTIVDGFSINSLFLEFDSTNNDYRDHLTSSNYIKIQKGGFVTNTYRIDSGGYTGSGNRYEITLDTPLGPESIFLDGETSATLTVLDKEIENKPEFEGRFFVKINRNFAFDTNIIKSFSGLEPRYGIIGSIVPREANGFDQMVSNPHRWDFYYRDNGETGDEFPLCGNTAHHWRNLGYGAWGGNRTFNSPARKYQPPTKGSDWVGILKIGNNWTDFISREFGKASNSTDGLLQAGVHVQFENKDTGEYSKVYRVLKAYKRFQNGRGQLVFRGWGGCGQSSNAGNRVTLLAFKLDQPVDDPWMPEAGDTTTLTTVAPTIHIVQEIISDNNKTLTSTNPAVFETEPKEAVDLDIYNEASDAIDISMFNTEYTLDKYYNCYSYGNGVESNRIRDDYNANKIDKGPKVSAPLDEPYAEERRGSGMVFSQIYNSMSGINRLNQFIQAEPITKDLNPIYGTIQKLHARDTDAIVLCEDKCLKVLANKDALYNADGNINLTGNNAVLGQAIPFVGEFGISKNPESFASYAYRAYFSDKNRGAVIRLSVDGITNIAEKGMSDFFADNLRSSTKILGSYDDDKDIYNITLNNLSHQWINELSTSKDYQLSPDCNIDQKGFAQTTISFKESVDGWTGRKSFIPESGLSLNNIYYTFKEGRIYEHGLNVLANNFYRVQYDSSFNLFINEMPQVVKGFSTINYTGTQSRRFEYLVNTKWYSIAEINFNTTTPTAIQQKQPGWYVNYIKTDLEGGEIKEFEKKEGKWFNYIKGLEIFNSCEQIGEGIGNPDVITIDTQEYFLTFTIDSKCSSSVSTPFGW